MASFVTITVLLMSLRIAIGSDDDRFSYKYGSSFLQGKMFGVKQWDEVSCDTLGQCVSSEPVTQKRNRATLYI